MSMEDKVVFFLIIITMILWGSIPIIEKIGLVKLDPIIGITIRNLTITIGLLIFIFWSGRYKELLEVDVKGILIFSASGLMAGLFGMWTYYTVLKQWPTSKVVPIFGKLSTCNDDFKCFNTKRGDKYFESDWNPIDCVRNLVG